MYQRFAAGVAWPLQIGSTPARPDLTHWAAERHKARHENVFCHFRHLHYWLAHALVRTFSPSSQKTAKRPGQQAEG
jgi:hypothetical protein